MCSCGDLGRQSTAMLGHRSARLLLLTSSLRGSARFGCVLGDHALPRLAVSSSLGSVVGAGNAIAAAAVVAGGTGAAHAAVTSAIAHVAVTAVAIASGACLSTKVDFLWPKVEEQPDSLVVDGVDVTGYPIFNDTKVQKAIAFARKAHFGQLRKTGEPYVTHCIHTGKFLAALVPSSGKRAVNTVVAGILHDVIDDTFENLNSIEQNFGDDVAHLVAGVSKLSYINQLLRRHRRKNISQRALTSEEANNLRVMLLGMVDDPRVVLIKLADRLHNMRTIYALPLPKAQAVAQETLAVWCSLASRLGMWALKAELEDLCFAVLQPHTFRKMRAELASMWSSNNRSKSLRRLSIKDGYHLDLQDAGAVSNYDWATSNSEGVNMRMKRKDAGIRHIYDARALRVVVGDKNGTLHGPAVKSCYSLLDIVHRLWTPIDGEFDDYIVNPKPSGYQSLHTAVQGPDNSPLEVQIRTQRMHEYAEFGLAAHWLYKESKVETPSSMHDSKISASSLQTNTVEHEGYYQDDAHQKYSSMKVGHPVLRVEGSQLLAAVIVRVDKGGIELLVAVSFALEASEAVAERRSSFQKKRWEAYARLYKKASDQWWSAPGHGDWCTCLEKYTLCQDGIFHKQDQFQRKLPTFIQIIDLTEQEESEYWMVMSAVFEGRKILPSPSASDYPERSSLTSYASAPVENGINNKVHLLRTMLRWEEQVRHGVTPGETGRGRSVTATSGEVAIVCWPHGDIMRMRSGSTAADAACRIGLDGKLVLVNGQLVLPHTELKDGDIVEVRM